MKRTALLLVVAMTCPGCLTFETRYDLYLQPDGSVQWMTMQFNVRSDEANPVSRAEEEARFLSAALEGRHNAALDLEAFGGQDIRTRILRDEVPYNVLTSARFRSIEEVMRNILREVGTGHEVVLEHGVMVNGVRCERLTIRLRIEDQPSSDGDSPVKDLMEGLTEMRINLQKGRFVAAEGFDVSTGVQARGLADEAGRTGVFWLAWTTEG